MATVFTDRREAGRELGANLIKYRGSAVVLALPRGGVETAVEVAQELEAPLDLAIARKIGHPTWPEYAIGAVTETGPVIWNEAEKISLDPIWLRQAEAEERAEVKRRREQYLDGRGRAKILGKTAILVDDGIATGLTMQAAIREVQDQKPDRVVVAAPVAPQDTIDDLLEEADEVIVLINPNDFRGAISAHYESFPQLEDKDVIDLLAKDL